LKIIVDKKSFRNDAGGTVEYEERITEPLEICCGGKIDGQARTQDVECG
jgi:hypothetical protein